MHDPGGGQDDVEVQVRLAALTAGDGLLDDHVETHLFHDRMLRIECKARADGFSQFYDGVNECDVLIVKSDRQEPLVVVRLSLAADIAKRAYEQSSRTHHSG